MRMIHGLEADDSFLYWCLERAYVVGFGPKLEVHLPSVRDAQPVSRIPSIPEAYLLDSESLVTQLVKNYSGVYSLEMERTGLILAHNRRQEGPELDPDLFRGGLEHREFAALCEVVRESLKEIQNLECDSFSRFGPYVFTSIRRAGHPVMMRWLEEDSLLVKASIGQTLASCGTIQDVAPVLIGRKRAVDPEWRECIVRRFGDEASLEQIDAPVIGRIVGRWGLYVNEAFAQDRDLIHLLYPLKVK